MITPCSSGKIPFRTKKKALAHAGTRPHLKRLGAWLRPYLCAECLEYHLTSGRQADLIMGPVPPVYKCCSAHG